MARSCSSVTPMRVGREQLLVVLEVDDVRAAAAAGDLVDELAHDLPRRPRVHERRRPAVREAKRAAPRVAEVERLEARRARSRATVAGSPGTATAQPTPREVSSFARLKMWTALLLVKS